MNSIRRRIAFGLALASTAVLAACGGGSSADHSSDNGTGLKGSTVSIGVLGVFSGFAAASSGGGAKAAEAWGKYINDNGGLNGHPVKLIVKDVGTTTGAGLRYAREMVTQDHVVAIIDQDLSDTSWLKIAETAGTPVIVANPGHGQLISPSAFPVVFSPATGVYALLNEGKHFGTRFGLVYATELAAITPLPIYKTMADAQGMTMPVISGVSISAPDFTSVCQQLLNAKVDSYTVAGGPAFTRNVADQCRQQGLQAPQVLLGPSAAGFWKTDPAYDQARVIDFVAQDFTSPLPEQKKYRAALEKYVPSFVGSTTDNTYASSTWLAGQVIAAAAKNVKGDLTGPSLKTAMYTLKGETLGGWSLPLTYNEGRTTSLPCWFDWRISDGTFETQSGAKPVCAPTAVITAADAQLAKAAGGG